MSELDKIKHDYKLLRLALINAVARQDAKQQAELIEKHNLFLVENAVYINELVSD